MSCTYQPGTGFEEERQISDPVAGNEIALSIFIPVADRDCGTLASAIG
jgi:hypothetical protein